MDVIKFIKDLRRKNVVYYQIWMPIIMNFDSDGFKRIKLTVPLKYSKTTYYRAIKFGLESFEKHVRDYQLEKTHSEILFHYRPLQMQDGVVVEKKIPRDTSATKRSSKEYTAKHPMQVYDEILQVLNQHAVKSYKSSTKAYQKLIDSKLSEGFTVEDFHRVSIVKSAKWKGTSYADHLRPETLFSHKFESYLNESPPITQQEKTHDKVLEATRLGFRKK